MIGISFMIPKNKTSEYLRMLMASSTVRASSPSICSRLMFSSNGLSACVSTFFVTVPAAAAALFLRSVSSYHKQLQHSKSSLTFSTSLLFSEW